MELLLVFGSMAWIVAAIAVAELYSRLLGGLMLAPLVLAFIVGLWRIPPEQSRQMAAALDKHAETPFGQLMRILNIAVILMVLAAALRWAYGQLS
jgi:hypothetical protein